MIEKHIHQIWIQGIKHLKGYNKTFFKYSKNIKETFEDCEYTLWDDDMITNEMEEDNPKLYEIYKSTRQYAAKSDIARYYILNKYGGIYIDMDYEAFENFYWLFAGDINFAVVMPSKVSGQKQLFNTYVNSTYGINNCVIGSSKNSIILEYIINKINKNANKNKIQNWKWIMTITGPTALENAVLKFKDKETIRFLPSSILEPIHYMDGTYNVECKNKQMCKDIFPSAVGIHRPSLSWFKNKTLLKKAIEFYDFCEKWWLFILLFVLYILLIMYMKKKYTT